MAQIMSSLLALWISTKSFTEAAGTFGVTPKVNSMVHAFVKEPVKSGFQAQVGGVKLALIAPGPDPALQDVLNDLTGIMNRVLTNNGFNGDNYAPDAAWNADTTLFEMSEHLIGLYPPADGGDPASILDTHGVL